MEGMARTRNTGQERDPLPIPREIKVLIAAAFVIAIGYGIVAPVLPQFATTFGVGVAAASAVVSVFAVARLLFAPAGGRILNRIGERPTYVTGVLIVALSSAATAFAQTSPRALHTRTRPPLVMPRSAASSSLISTKNSGCNAAFTRLCLVQ